MGISTSPTAEDTEMEWFDNMQNGLKLAKKTGKPLFIDFTGFTCTNCRWMEQNMFKRSEINSRMQEFVKVRLFTDRRSEPYISNKKLQQENYGSIELPLYVIISPEGKFMGTKTFTRDMQEYVDFLDKGLATKINK
jgi:thiol:disulfide interchange protein DsbD